MGDMADEYDNYDPIYEEEIESDYDVSKQTVTVYYPEWVISEQRDRY